MASQLSVTDELRALDEKKGPEIMAIFQENFQIFNPRLLAHKAEILSVPRKTESYGAHPRQQLDIYETTTADPSNAPILVFFYGGGLVMGDKIVSNIDDGLLYHNVGSFFAKRGITTIIPDYRRVNSSFGGEDAVFPSGGDDVSLSLQWVDKTFGSAANKRKVIIMGNSAGGVHISTFLFEPKYLDQRKLYAGGDSGIRLDAAVELAVPLHFGDAPERTDMLKSYYGSVEEAKKHSTLGLVEGMVAKGQSQGDVAIPRILALLGEWEPNEVSKPMHEFTEYWKKTWGGGYDFKLMPGHNHLSPTCSLLAGDPKAEEWAEDIIKWLGI